MVHNKFIILTTCGSDVNYIGPINYNNIMLSYSLFPLHGIGIKGIITVHNNL